jgi:hypothetical protein
MLREGAGKASPQSPTAGKRVPPPATRPPPRILTRGAVYVCGPPPRLVRPRQPRDRLGQLLPQVKRVKVADRKANVADVAALRRARADAGDVDVEIGEVAVLLVESFGRRLGRSGWFVGWWRLVSWRLSWWSWFGGRGRRGRCPPGQAIWRRGGVVAVVVAMVVVVAGGGGVAWPAVWRPPFPRRPEMVWACACRRESNGAAPRLGRGAPAGRRSLLCPPLPGDPHRPGTAGGGCKKREGTARPVSRESSNPGAAKASCSANAAAGAAHEPARARLHARARPRPRIP